LDLYLKDYYWVSSNSEDLSLPRWKEAPHFPLSLLRELVRSKSSGLKSEQAMVEARLKEENKLDGAFGWNYWQRSIFWRNLQRARKLVSWREKTRVFTSKTNYFLHRIVACLADHYVDSHWISVKEDIYCVEFQSLLEFFQHRNSSLLQQEIDHYKCLKELYRNYTPPNTISSSCESISSSFKRPASGKVMRVQGVGCSSGVCVGPVHKVMNLDELAWEKEKIHPNSILVVQYP
jgi:hypothetical protein